MQSTDVLGDMEDKWSSGLQIQNHCRFKGVKQIKTKDRPSSDCLAQIYFPTIQIHLLIAKAYIPKLVSTVRF
jgi:hypothetical protein